MKSVITWVFGMFIMGSQKSSVTMHAQKHIHLWCMEICVLTQIQLLEIDSVRTHHRSMKKLAAITASKTHHLTITWATQVNHADKLFHIIRVNACMTKQTTCHLDYRSLRIFLSVFTVCTKKPWALVLASLPSRYTTWKQRHINVNATLWRRIDVETTLFWRHEPAGLMILFVCVDALRPSFSHTGTISCLPKLKGKIHTFSEMHLL